MPVVQPKKGVVSITNCMFNPWLNQTSDAKDFPHRPRGTNWNLHRQQTLVLNHTHLSILSNQVPAFFAMAQRCLDIADLFQSLNPLNPSSSSSFGTQTKLHPILEPVTLVKTEHRLDISS